VTAANNVLRRFTLITVIAVSVCGGTGFTVDRYRLNGMSVVTYNTCGRLNHLSLLTGVCSFIVCRLLLLKDHALFLYDISAA